MKALLHMMGTALTADRNTPSLAGISPVLALTVEASEKMYVGGIAAVDYTDEIKMAADTAGLRVIGVVGENVDNTVDGHTISVVNRGIYRFANSTTYAIPRSAIGEVCFVEDDHTVASFSTNLVAAGLVFDVDSSGVWVDMRPEALAQARLRTPPLRVAKTADYTVTAAIAFQGITWFDVDDTALVTITLPSAVGGYRVGVRRKAATEAHDVAVQCASGDKIQGGDAMSAAGKKVDNTTDAVTDIIWWRAADDTHWIIDNPASQYPQNWPKNDT